MLRALPARVLDAPDEPAVRELLDTDPVAACMLAGRIETHGVAPVALGAPLWGLGAAGRLDAVCLAGANLIPFARPGAEVDAARAFADRARRAGRRCSTIVGPMAAVSPLWERLQPFWGPARDVRPRQPLLAIDGPPLVAAEPRVRPVRLTQLETLLPAAIAMFTEEVGVSPLRVDGGAGYRARVTELVRAGQSLAWISDDEVVFKAEVGAVSRSACQIQGVWVAPRYRGRGIGQAGTAAVVDYARRAIAPVVSLYVKRLQRHGPGRLPPGRLPRRGHLRLRPVLRPTGILLGCADDGGTVLLVTTAVLAGPVLAACSGSDPTDEARSAAQQFLDDWSAGDLAAAAAGTDAPDTATPLLDRTATDLPDATLTAELGAVTVGGEDEDTATAGWDGDLGPAGRPRLDLRRDPGPAPRRRRGRRRVAGGQPADDRAPRTGRRAAPAAGPHPARAGRDHRRHGGSAVHPHRGRERRRRTPPR